MGSSNVLSRVEHYIRENFLYARTGFPLGPDDSLIESGVIDSMGVMELVAFLEEDFGIDVTDVDITETNLGSLAAIASYVSAKLAGIALVEAG